MLSVIPHGEEDTMNDQEMQFADPDWKPTRPLNKNNVPQEQEIDATQPVNARPQEQQWQAPPPLRDYQDGYAGAGQQIPPDQKLDYPSPDSYSYAPPNNVTRTPYRQQARRRGRSPWLWIIIAIIILGFMSGGFGSAFRGFGFQNSVTVPQTFTVTNQPTIIINDLGGSVHVQSSGSSKSVNVQAIKQADIFSNPNNEKVAYNQDGNTITISFDGQGGSVDFNLTVPDNSNLQIHTNSDDISVDGISGQMILSTDSGDITTTNDILSTSSLLTDNSGDINGRQDQLAGTTTLNDNSGDINFDGSITGSGNYQFTTNSGDITANLNGNASVNASTDSGSIDRNVPTIDVQNNDSGATASGYIGSPGSSSQLTFKTNSGDIHLNTRP